jgi:hypothetical protein
MTAKRVDLEFGWRSTSAMDAAGSELFPHAGEPHDTRNCLAPREKYARVWVCAQCMVARDEWNSQQRPTDEAVRDGIVGKWTSKRFLGMTGPFSFTFEMDGTAELMRDGVATNRTAWRVEDGWVYIAPNGELPPNSDLYWNVLSIDEHNLEFATGFSTAGTERFTR